MKKQGYTLAEVLVTLTIIGIIAAVMLPLINKFKPDPVKAMYLKSYYSLTKVLNDIANNETFYTIADGNNPKAPFWNTEAIVSNGHTDIEGGNGKLCRLLDYYFAGQDSGRCSNEYIAPENINFEKDFTAKNGVDFMVTTKIADFYQTDIYIDVNGNDGNNCIYNEDSCPNPDRFRFMVAANGKIVAGDPMGKYYLDTRGIWKFKKDKTLGDVKDFKDFKDFTLPDYLEHLPKEKQAEPDDPECPAGQIWSANAQACVTPGEEEEQQHDCADGTVWNEELQACVTQGEGGAEVPNCSPEEHIVYNSDGTVYCHAPCTLEQKWDSALQQCVNKITSPTGPESCPDGYIWDSKINSCKEITRIPNNNLVDPCESKVSLSGYSKDCNYSYKDSYVDSSTNNKDSNNYNTGGGGGCQNYAKYVSWKESDNFNKMMDCGLYLELNPSASHCQGMSATDMASSLDAHFRTCHIK